MIIDELVIEYHSHKLIHLHSMFNIIFNALLKRKIKKYIYFLFLVFYHFFSFVILHNIHCYISSKIIVLYLGSPPPTQPLCVSAAHHPRGLYMSLQHAINATSMCLCNTPSTQPLCVSASHHPRGLYMYLLHYSISPQSLYVSVALYPHSLYMSLLHYIPTASICLCCSISPLSLYVSAALYPHGLYKSLLQYVYPHSLHIRVECGIFFLIGQNRSNNQRSGMILEVQIRSFSTRERGARRRTLVKVFILKKFQGA